VVVDVVVITGCAGEGDDDSDGPWRSWSGERERCWSATPSRRALLGRVWVVGDAASAVLITRGGGDGERRGEGKKASRVERGIDGTRSASRGKEI
jgi:hypothetical protein